MILIFAWTAQALLDGRKTVTRRRWSNSHAEKFRAGTLIRAFNDDPRRGGKEIAKLRVVDVRREPIEAVTLEDVRREGFDQYSVEDFIRFWYTKHKLARAPGDLCWRVEFKVVELVCS